jgi:hypothetical protein
MAADSSWRTKVGGGAQGAHQRQSPSCSQRPFPKNAERTPQWELSCLLLHLSSHSLMPASCSPKRWREERGFHGSQSPKTHIGSGGSTWTAGSSPIWGDSRSATTSNIRVGVFVGVVRAGRSPSSPQRLSVCPANEALSERRRRDSNPRYPVERYNTLAGCRLQPLGHSSESQEYIKDVLRLRA